MRDILFRGRRIDNDEWVYGYYVHIGPVSCKKSYIIPEYASALYVIEVDPPTIGQHTGLTGKSGKPIFEGDIVQYHERQFDGKDKPVRDAVVYEEGGFATRAYFLNNWLWNSINGNVQLRDVEIIGNIHDKPELLKEGADNA